MLTLWLRPEILKECLRNIYGVLLFVKTLNIRLISFRNSQRSDFHINTICHSVIWCSGSEIMSEALLNNSVTKHGFRHIQIPVQIKVLVLKGAVRLHMENRKSSTRPSKAHTLLLNNVDDMFHISSPTLRDHLEQTSDHLFLSIFQAPASPRF